MPKEPTNNLPEDEETLDKAASPEGAERRSYYYDDAHGYEEYDPKKDDVEQDEEDEFDD